MTQLEIDTVLLKTASRCNLDCGYCYVYNMGDDGWREQPKKMSSIVIDAIVRQLAALASKQTRPFSICMHGGEPLMLGLSATRALLAGLRGALPDACTLHVQTNGVLLSDAFVELFVEHSVGVSVSIDGPAHVHNAARPDKRGGGSHARVMQGIDRLRRHGRHLFSGVLAVVDVTADPGEIYAALKSTGAPGIDFLYRDGNRDALPRGKTAIDSTEYGAWMRAILRIYASDPEPPRIRVLDDMMRLVLGGKAYKEGLGVTDFGILVIDTDGSVTKNDTLKVAHGGGDRFAHKWSILDTDISEIVASPQFRQYHDLQRPTAPECTGCFELTVCGGGMPAHRWSQEKGFANPSIYCADQKLLIGDLRNFLAAAKAA